MPIEQALLDEIVQRVVRVAQPDRIILFGSAARGDRGPDSDVDLLIVKSGVPHRGHREEEIHLSFFGLGVPIDVVVVTPEDLEKYRDRIGPSLAPRFRRARKSMPPDRLLKNPVE